MLELLPSADRQVQQVWYKTPVLLTYATIFIVFYLIIFFWPTGATSLFSKFGFFFFLGLAGALVANSTGAGGGVIFIPFFSAIGFTATETVGTSMGIQCFGMTAGALSWLACLSKEPDPLQQKTRLLKKLLLLTGFPTIIGILAGQYFIPPPKLDIVTIFKSFSIIFGLILFASTLLNRHAKDLDRATIKRWEHIPIIFTCLIGGVITSWISVGVGEGIALLLFFLGFKPRIAVAIGVYTSSISVLTGIVKNLFILESVSFEVLLFAGQAALIGGYFARYITSWLGGFYLKIFFSLWILLTGLLML